MTHLTSDELIDAMEAEADDGKVEADADRRNAAGMLSTERQAHLAACEECRRQVDDLAATLNKAKQLSVPEPSPLFWNHFSERVRTAVDTESASGSPWPSWLRWQTLLPIGAVATIILALMISVPKQDRSETLSVEDARAAAATIDVPATDNWDAFTDLVGELDIETASAAGVIELGFAEQAVLALTADEQVELTRLLQAELTRAKS